MAKKTIFSQATSLLKEANKLTDKIGFTPKVDEPEKEENAEPALDSVEGISSWLETVKCKADPALVQVVQSQIQVLGLVDSPTMSGMMIDNLVQCLDSSLKQSSSEEQKAGIRDAFIRTIQNYVFLSEAKLKYAVDKNKDEAKQLLTQAGSMISDTISSVTSMAVPELGSVAVGNILGSVSKQEGFFQRLGSWIGSKKIIETKTKEFNQTIKGFFETLDKYPNLFGRSIVLNGMLTKYRHVLVDARTEELMVPVKKRMSTSELDGLLTAAGELSAVLSTASEGNIFKAAGGALSSLSKLATGALKRKSANFDVHSFCVLWDACEKDAGVIREEIAVEKEKLKQLKEQQKNIGIFKISQRKEAQAEIDEQLALLDKRKAALDEAELKLEQLKKMFPEAHSIKAAIDSYDEELAAIENKYKVL